MPEPQRTRLGRSRRGTDQPQPHRTVDRVTRIVEEVVYRPGITFGEIARAVDAPKSSVHGFVGGLLAAGWLYETDRRFYLGPAVYALTLVSGPIRAGVVGLADLADLHEKTGLAVFVGVLAGDNLIYVAEVGSDPVTGFDAQSNVRRSPLATAGGKALLSERSDHEMEAYLRRRGPEESELVQQFLAQVTEIRRTRLATNVRQGGARVAVATTIQKGDGSGAVASVTLVGRADKVQPRIDKLGKILLRSVASWQQRPATAREEI